MALEDIKFKLGDEILFDIGDYKEIRRGSNYINFKQGKIIGFFEKRQPDDSKDLIATVDFIITKIDIPYDVLKKYARPYSP